jgi:hypothetical protein
VTARASGLVVLGLLAASGGVVACRGGSDGAVASLLEMHGVVERADGYIWRGAAAGDRFALGGAIRTGAGSSARVRLEAGAVIRLGENARLRFERGNLPGASAPELRVERGVAEIEHDANVELALVTSAGRTRIEKGARVRVRSLDDGVTLEVLVGRAVLLKPDGDLAVEAGTGARLRIGGALIEKIDLKVGAAIIEPLAPAAEPEVAVAPAADADAAAPAAEAPEAAPAAPAPEAHAARSGPDRADVTIAAGESAVLHDGKSSLWVRLRFDHLCPREGTVETGRAGHPRERLTAAGAAMLRLRTGKEQYRVRCAGDRPTGNPRASGVLSLLRDKGEVPLPARVGANVIDADGRRYTILYQSRPPALTLVWPAAPGDAKDLELHVQSPSGTRTLPSKDARQRLASGSLAEGNHTWWYATKDGRESPRTTIVLRFDNTAPTAQFFKAAPAPADGPGMVPVDGVTLPGAAVTAAGKPIDVDENGRFRAAVAPLAGDSAVAVRLEPVRGRVHYYIRRRPEER